MAGTGGQHTQQQAVKPRAALCPLPLHPYLSPHGGRRVQRSCPRNIIIIIIVPEPAHPRPPSPHPPSPHPQSGHVSGLAYSFRPRSLTSLVTAHAIAV